MGPRCCHWEQGDCPREPVGEIVPIRGGHFRAWPLCDKHATVYYQGHLGMQDFRRYRRRKLASGNGKAHG